LEATHLICCSQKERKIFPMSVSAVRAGMGRRDTKWLLEAVFEGRRARDFHSGWKA
jgi:hypothetical protein